MTALPTIRPGAANTTGLPTTGSLIANPGGSTALSDDSDTTFDGQNANSTGTYQYGRDLGNTPSNFGTMDTVTLLLRYGWESAPSNSTWDTLSARIMASDGSTVLAAGTSGGAFQVFASSITVATPTDGSATGFAYVNTSATKAQWDGAILQVEWSRTRSKGGDSLGCRVYEADIGGTYTAGAIDETGLQVTATATISETDAATRVENPVVSGAVSIYGFAETDWYARTLSSITDYMTTPSSPGDPNTDLDIRVDVALDSWTSAVNNAWALIGQRSDSTAAQRKYQMDWDPFDVREQLLWHDGTSEITQNTGPFAGFDPLTRVQLRITLDLDNGSGAYVVSYYYRTDGLMDSDTGWTSLGTDTGGTTTSLQTGVTEPIHVGQDSTVGNDFGGRWFRAWVRSGLDSTGTVVCNPDWRTAAQTSDGITFTDDAGLDWTFVGSATWNGSVGTPTENVSITVAATITETDAATRAEAVQITAAATITGTDAVRRNEAGLVVTVAATITETDAPVFLEPVSIVVSSTISGTDVLSAVDDLSTTGTVTVSETDVLSAVDDLVVTVPATISETDVLSAVDDLGFTVAATISGTDAPIFLETGLVTVATATIAGSDVLSAVDDVRVDVASAISETDALRTSEAVSLTVAATISETDAIAGTTENVQITVAATISGTDVLSAVDDLSFTVAATITETDSTTGVYDETGLGFTVAATVTGSDVATRVEDVAVTGSASIVETDVLSGSENVQVDVLAGLSETDVLSGLEVLEVLVVSTAIAGDGQVRTESLSFTIAATISETDAVASTFWIRDPVLFDRDPSAYTAAPVAFVKLDPGTPDPL